MQMNKEIFNFIEALEVLLTNRISFFFIAMLATVFQFEFLKKIPLKLKASAPKWIWGFGILNGFFVALLCGFVNRVAPVWSMIIFPLLLVVELMVMSEDSLRSYVRIWLKCVFKYSCIYWGVANILGLILIEGLTKKLVFSVSLLSVSIWTLYLAKSTKFSMKSYRTMIHEKAAGKLYFRYFTLCCLFLVFITFNAKVFVLNKYMDVQAQRMFCVEMFLKVAFIWWSSRLLFVMITNQLSYVQNETYTENILVKERAFRNTIMRKGIFSLNLDITRDEIKEGMEWLNPEAWGENVSSSALFARMIECCIHPEDAKEFIHNNDRVVIRERVDTAPYYSHQIRVSPKGMVQNFSLGEELTKRYQNTDKEWVWLKLDYIYTRDSLSGDIFSYIAVFDVDLQVEQGEKLRQSASTDFLTGVLNRASVEKQIGEKLEKNLNAGTFFIIDVDNFKNVNDILGHPVGDQLLKQISAILTELFRKEDLVGRLGGDEFCAFMKDVVDPEVIEAKARMLNEKCRIECSGEHGELVKVSVSIGIASCHKDIVDYGELYRCADLALYETKRMGKDTFTIYKEGM